MTITAYCIYPDNFGELTEVNRDEPPEFVTLTMASPEEDGVRQYKAHCVGLRWVGKVRQFAWVYDSRGDYDIFEVS